MPLPLKMKICRQLIFESKIYSIIKWYFCHVACFKRLPSLLAWNQGWFHACPLSTTSFIQHPVKHCNTCTINEVGMFNPCSSHFKRLNLFEHTLYLEDLHILTFIFAVRRTHCTPGSSSDSYIKTSLLFSECADLIASRNCQLKQI